MAPDERCGCEGPCRVLEAVKVRRARLEAAMGKYNQYGRIEAQAIVYVLREIEEGAE